MSRSVKIASLEVSVGDVVAIAAADDEEEEAEAGAPVGLLQALWQTAKGKYGTAYLPDWGWGMNLG